MSLDLPADLEPFVDPDAWHSAGAYALVLERPDDLAATWDREYKHRPDWFEEFRQADTVCYVGGTSDLLARLTDHAAGDVRTTALTEVCDIARLQTVVLAEGRRYDVVEYNLAATLRRERPSWFVHQR